VCPLAVIVIIFSVSNTMNADTPSSIAYENTNRVATTLHRKERELFKF
jgi:hypothetical protein